VCCLLLDGVLICLFSVGLLLMIVWFAVCLFLVGCGCVCVIVRGVAIMVDFRLLRSVCLF